MELDAVFFDELLGALLVEVEDQGAASEAEFVTTFHRAQEEFRFLIGLRRKGMEAVCAVEVELEEVDKFLSLDDPVWAVRSASAFGVKMMSESLFTLKNLLGDGLA